LISIVPGSLAAMISGQPSALEVPLGHCPASGGRIRLGSPTSNLPGGLMGGVRLDVPANPSAPYASAKSAIWMPNSRWFSVGAAAYRMSARQLVGPPSKRPP